MREDIDRWWETYEASFEAKLIAIDHARKEIGRSIRKTVEELIAGFREREQ